MNPKVSVIIPFYNSEKWIGQCLESIFKQTYENIEVIFVDNESKDRSVEIAHKVKDQYGSLIIDSAPNIYPNCWDEARSRGFELMTGDYVLVIGSDDFLYKTFIENCMKFILSAPDKIKAFQSPIRGVKEDTNILLDTIGHNYNSIDEFKNLCLQKCPVNTPTVIYNTQLYKDGLLNTKPETYGGAADYDLYCNLADNGIMIYPSPQWLGFYYRWHTEQATWKVHKEGKNYDAMIQNFWRSKWKTKD